MSAAKFKKIFLIVILIVILILLGIKITLFINTPRVPPVVHTILGFKSLKHALTSALINGYIAPEDLPEDVEGVFHLLSSGPEYYLTPDNPEQSTRDYTREGDKKLRVVKPNSNTGILICAKNGFSDYENALERFRESDSEEELIRNIRDIGLPLYDPPGSNNSAEIMDQIPGLPNKILVVYIRYPRKSGD